MQEQIILDYTIQSPQKRVQLVQKIIDQTPPEKLTKYYLEKMANYIIFAMTKEERKNKKINTQNRMVTINKRETSFQGLVMKFENGEDGIYNMITNDKNMILTPKVSITANDIAEIPALATLRQAIQQVQSSYKNARGRRKYLLKKQLIEMRQDQYVIKMAYKQPITCLNGIKNFSSMCFDNDIKIKNNKKQIVDNGLVSLINPLHVSALLCNYSSLKENCYGKFSADGYYLIQDLENIIDKYIKNQYPLYFKIIVYKIDELKNIEIQSLLEKEFGIKHSVEYISVLWRHKIPLLIAKAAEKQYLQWYFTMRERGEWKKCTRCGSIKLANNVFFSKNRSSKDGFYSICKDCRNSKKTKITSKDFKIIKKISYEQGKKYLK